uniref:Uncharacterized protein n=1 Tax=viral metagenome TaxID=1070528 RepID=A0A6M3J0J4_9ZZZZ
MSKEDNTQKEGRFGEALIDVIEKHAEELTNVQMIGTMLAISFSMFYSSMAKKDAKE